MNKTLLDTNVVLRLLVPNDPQHAPAVRAVEAALREGVQLVVAPQVIIEGWVVLTRPADVNGLGWGAASAREALGGVIDQFHFLPETPEVFTVWWTLVGSGVKGKRAHDARLAAWMQVHEIEQVLTFNARDFQGFDNITAIIPEGD